MAITMIQALISKLEIETENFLKNSETTDSDILDVFDMFLRLTSKKSILEKIEAKKNEILDNASSNLDDGDVFKIGLRQFIKIREYELAKLDESKLSQFIPDSDQFTEFFKTVPKTQKEVQELLVRFGVNADVKQFYTSEPKNTFKIKAKN